MNNEDLEFLQLLVTTLEAAKSKPTSDTSSVIKSEIYTLEFCIKCFKVIKGAPDEHKS